MPPDLVVEKPDRRPFSPTPARDPHARRRLAPWRTGFVRQSRAILGFLLCTTSPARAVTEAFEENRLEKEVLDTGCRDAVQLQVAGNGDVYFIERAGDLKVFSPPTRTTRTLGMVPAALKGEAGLTGFALAPGFERNGWLYVYFSPKAEPKKMRISRFTVANGALDVQSEKITLEWTAAFSHVGGGMQFDPSGELWLSTGINDDANSVACNTQDLRGKVLRIRPEPDGSYTIPAGNLFSNPQEGRPEIYVMGCRNPYRMFYDAPSRALFFGDVGPNTAPGIGHGGYDEVNRATAPGNYGWSMFTGPNVANVGHDEKTGGFGREHSPARPINDAPTNTGLRELPPARPPLIWYPSEDSREFPELGNGGRCAMAGPVYHFNPILASPVKLPVIFDRQLFIYDWSRNWIKTVALDAQGGVAAIRPFLGRQLFRRPTDLKFGPDGALYMIEFGERWHGNVDGVLSRIVYRRGNRPPRAVATAGTAAGRIPLEVSFSGAASSDPDGDALSYDWKFGDGSPNASGREAKSTYHSQGVHYAELTVTDSSELSATATVRIVAGNAPPQVRISPPTSGAFFDWGERVPYAIAIEDAEDGTTASGTIPAGNVHLQWTYRQRPGEAPGTAAEIGLHGAGGIMRRSDCLSCHTLTTASVGPNFLLVAEKYRNDPAAPPRLAEAVLKGGSGNWGVVPMPPHPQLSSQDIAQITEYILNLRPRDPGQELTGIRGELATAAKPLGGGDVDGIKGGGAYVLSARYTDRGAPGVPPLTGEAKIVLHARRKRVALFDDSSDVQVMEVSELTSPRGGRSRRICVQFSAGSHVSFKEINLSGIRQIRCEVAAGAGHGGVLEFRADSPAGRLIGRAEIPVTGAWENWTTVTAPLQDSQGVHELFVVGGSRGAEMPTHFNLDVLEFMPAQTEAGKLP